MAKLIPSLSSCSHRMTAGERRFAERLEEKLGDEVLIWYDVPVGNKRLQPDFVILHPQRGLFILEVKDWKLETIQQINPLEVTLLTNDGPKMERNPLEKARDYAFAVRHPQQSWWLDECDRPKGGCPC